MNLDFSPATQRALDLANSLARERGRAEANGADLLLGLLDDEWSRTSELFERHRLDRLSTREELKRLEPDHPPSLHEILVRTRGLSLRHGSDSTITGEFLLLGILEADGVVREKLIGLGLSLPALEESILGKLGEPIPLDAAVQLLNPVDESAAGRILDVNANRVRESLRILDDYCRFVLDDEFLTREVKSVRHEFVAVMESLPEGVLLTSRETLGDVGTGIALDGEYLRKSPRHLAQVNLKRLQESLRSLEEYTKIVSEVAPRKLEQLRYRTYTIEKIVLIGTDARERLAGVGLYLLIGSGQSEASLEWTVQEAIAGGVQMVQLREKQQSDREILERARRLRKITREAGVLFILNDRPDLARLAEADGLHLGQDDLPLSEARKIVGPEMLIGVSTHHLDQVREAIRGGASYLGVGPTFPSKTKQFEDFSGLRFVEEVSRETTLPWFAIGGIGGSTIDEAIRAGASRVAVSAAIASESDPRRAARALREALEGR